MSILNHPAFQSLVLPLLAALMALTLLGGWRKRGPSPWAGLSAALALLAALAVFPGLDWPAASRAQKLPWIVLGSSAVAAVMLTGVTRARGGIAPAAIWPVGWGIWGLASLWLAGGSAQWPMGLASMLGGALVLGALLPPRQADANTAWAAGAVAQTAVLAVLAAGLAALGALGGSLLLAQLAMALAVVTGVLALWAWLAPAGGVLCHPAALLPLGVVWLALAQVLSATVVSGVMRSGLMALALAFAPWLARSAWGVRQPRWVPWLAAGLALVPMALALLPLWGDLSVAGPAGTNADNEDPYYRPAWD